MNESVPVSVLCMEDDWGLARLLQKRLERAGYAVDLAYDGEEGLVKYEAKNYDVLAVDQNMPVYNGLDVIRRLARLGPLPPLIMVTGSGSEKIAVEAMKLGAGDYIVKDVELGYLELIPMVIDQVLQRYRLAEEKRRADEERERLIKELQAALAEVKNLSGLLPICASCKKIRDDQGYWQAVEVYITDRFDAQFTHGICPDCMNQLYGDYVCEIDEEEQGRPH